MEIIFKNEENINFIIENEKINFDIQISLKNEQLFFNYLNKNDNSSKQKNFIFEELQIISKLFSIYDNIKEIFEFIKDIILNSESNKKYPKIIKNDKEEYFVIYLNIGKYKSIEFPLDSEYQKNQFKIEKNILNEIEDDLKNFDSFVETYEKKIDNLKNENKQLKLKIENYKEKIKISDKNFYYYNINNSNKHYVLIQSNYKSIKFNELLILEKNFYICNLIISNKINKKLYFHLIYKATIDGDKAQNFHNKVDGIGPLIIFVKTSKNLIIGGYTSLPWSSSDKFVSDSNAFLFSLKNGEKYNIINPNNACFHSKNNGPCFGNFSELYIADNCLKEKSSTTNYESECYGTNLIDKKNIGMFQVKDYEVYKVIIYG